MIQNAVDNLLNTQWYQEQKIPWYQEQYCVVSGTKLRGNGNNNSWYQGKILLQVIEIIRDF